MIESFGNIKPKAFRWSSRFDDRFFVLVGSATSERKKLKIQFQIKAGVVLNMSTSVDEWNVNSKTFINPKSSLALLGVNKIKAGFHWNIDTKSSHGRMESRLISISKTLCPKPSNRIFTGDRHSARPEANQCTSCVKKFRSYRQVMWARFLLYDYPISQEPWWQRDERKPTEFAKACVLVNRFQAQVNGTKRPLPLMVYKDHSFLSRVLADANIWQRDEGFLCYRKNGTRFSYLSPLTSKALGHDTKRMLSKSNTLDAD